MFQKSVRADPAERSRALPGDELISAPVGSLTHAVTIRRSPREVWPWLAQMGAGRGGWYSYDCIDNGGQPSADQILPQFQAITVGTVFPALPGVTDGFVLIQFEPERSLVLAWPSPDRHYLTTWAFILQEREPGVTRLLARSRAGRGYRFHGVPMWLIGMGHFIMQRKQLLGIMRRAEGRARLAA